MEYRKDIKNEGRNIIIGVILAITFLLLATCATAQIKTNVYPHGIVYKYNEKPMYFGDEKNKERLCLDITADSLGYKNYKIQMSVRTPIEIGRCDVKVGFPDGSFEYIQSTGYFSGVSVNVYELTEAQINKLKSAKHDVISFETENSKLYCTNIKHPTFFTDFLNNYYK
jgi:hypothetical protein